MAPGDLWKKAPWPCIEMIDRHARDILESALSRLIAGELSTREFNQLESMRSEDRAIEEIWLFGDAFYPDMGSSNRLIGENAVSQEAREMGARCKLFLHTDLEYSWPPLSRNLFFYHYLIAVLVSFTATIGSCTLGYLGFIGAAACSLALAVIGLAAIGCVRICDKVTLRRDLEAYWKTGDKDGWPFLRKTDHERALARLTSVG